MTKRELFLSTIQNLQPRQIPYFPDLSDWYAFNRTPIGELLKYGAGALIPDEDLQFHRNYNGQTLPKKYCEFTYLDFYREFDWGCPVHLYDWFRVEYEDVKVNCSIQGNQKIMEWILPEGILRKIFAKAEDGSWCPVEFPIKSVKDLELWSKISERSHFIPLFHRIYETLNAEPDRIVLDLVLSRSPYGKLVHELVGVENLIYWMFDEPDIFIRFMEEQAVQDLKLAELAASAPLAQVVIMSDHSDENLISPPNYQKYCVPFYRQIVEIIHAGGKKLSSHLDGSFKGYMPLLKETGFDILDGCTPFPMSNYHVNDLADLVQRNNFIAWCGVPSTLICQNLADEEVLRVGEEILHAFNGSGRLIFNIGDIVSPLANIEQVIALGNLVK